MLSLLASCAASPAATTTIAASGATTAPVVRSASPVVTISTAITIAPVVGESSTAAVSPARTTAAAVIYHSKQFKAPLTVMLDPQPRFTLDLDSPSLLTWTSSYNSNNKVRLMIPAEYYPGGAGPARPAPLDDHAYLTYLKALKAVTYTQVRTITVDGVVGSIMTADVMNDGMDGSIGCPTVGADQADGCFGFGPDLTIRLAVLKRGSSTLLIWARTNSTLPDENFLGQFETMLQSIRWR